MKKIQSTAAALLLTVLLTGCGAVPELFSAAPSSGESSIIQTAERPAAETGETEEAETEESGAELSADADNGYGFPNLRSFSAHVLGGDTFTEADLAEKDVTVINIWSTTCPPCIEEMGEIGDFERTLPENVRVMTWCLDAEYAADKRSIREFLEQVGYEGITLTSGDGDLMKIYDSLMYTPTTLFYDARGVLSAEPLIGAGDVAARYTEGINQVLAGQGKDLLPE